QLVFFLFAHRTSAPRLFPYTTLFRSPTNSRLSARLSSSAASRWTRARSSSRRAVTSEKATRVAPSGSGRVCQAATRWSVVGASRSEEHTSELQSRENLVCRLLLEKKN